MYDREIRWSVLLPLSILLGMGMLAAEVFRFWPAFPARPDLFWCLAFLVGLRAPPGPAILAAAWCGVTRDCLLGSRLGSTLAAYVLAAWVLEFWKPLVAVHLWPIRALAVGLTGFFVALVKHFLDAGSLGADLWLGITVISAADAVLTMLCYLPMALMLSFPSFRPWRERGGYFF